jgi:hypothetical protein
MNHAGLGQERPSDLNRNDDEFQMYRKRMMLAYRFRPNPLVRNPPCSRTLKSCDDRLEQPTP